MLLSPEEYQPLNSEIQISQFEKSRKFAVPKQSKSNLAYAVAVGVIKKQGKPQILYWLIHNKTGHQQLETPLNNDCNDCNISQNRPVYKYYKGETIPLNPLVICYVLQGSVKITTFCETGEEVLLGLAIPDMVFGSNITALNTYEAIALSDVELVTIPEAEIAANPLLSHKLLPKIKQRLRQTECFLFILGRRRVKERLQHLLLLLKQEIGQPVANGTRLSVRLTHEELASACCTTRVTITRLMSALHKQKFISFDFKNHIIINNDVLEKFSGNQMFSLLSSHNPVIK